VCSLAYAQWLNRRAPVEVREAPGASLAEIRASTERPESELPSFFASMLPVLLPALLLASFSFIDMAEKQQIRSELRTAMTTAAAGNALDEAAYKTEVTRRLADPQFFSGVHAFMKLAGHMVLALALGALIALVLVRRQCKLSWQSFSEKCAGPLETAGVIILITSAGGAFGLMIRESGIGDVIKASAESFSINLILLAWFVTAVIRIAEELAHRRAHGIPLHKEVIEWFAECTREMSLPALATSPGSAS
jgi:GntP family gluconate:H+ symporter